MKTETAGSSETTIKIYQTTRRHISDDVEKCFHEYVDFLRNLSGGWGSMLKLVTTSSFQIHSYITDKFSFQIFWTVIQLHSWYSVVKYCPAAVAEVTCDLRKLCASEILTLRLAAPSSSSLMKPQLEDRK
jgi:hypothetical protein